MRLLDEGDMPSPGVGSPQKQKDRTMKNETKVKKLVLKKETLRDLTAQNAGEVKGGSRAGGCSWWCTYTVKPCHRLTKGKPCH